MKIQNLSFYFCCCICFAHTEVPFNNLRYDLQSLHHSLYERALQEIQSKDRNYLSAEIWIYFQDGSIEKFTVSNGENQYFVSGKKAALDPNLEIMFDKPKLKLYVKKNANKNKSGNNLSDTEY